MLGEDIKMQRKVYYLGVSVTLLCIALISTGCRQKMYLEYEAPWVFEDAEISIASCEGFMGMTIEIGENIYECGVAHENDGTGMSIYDKSVVGGYTDKALVWEASCELKDDLLYLSIEVDNISDYEGKTIVLHQESEEDIE